LDQPLSRLYLMTVVGLYRALDNPVQSLRLIRGTE
jgi:hypothetical protein